MVTVGQSQILAIIQTFDYGELNVVFTGQCRPLSKTVRFNVLRVAKSKAATKTFGKF
jgi:ribosomal protein S17